MDAIAFLGVEDLLLLHADTIERDGGLSGVREYGLLESAAAMPRQQFGGHYLHEDLPAMAAAYMYHVSQNHPFVDGNKRVAVMAAYVFLDANGVEFAPAPKELESIALKVAAGQLSKDQLTDWMRQQISAC